MLQPSLLWLLLHVRHPLAGGLFDWLPVPLQLRVLSGVVMRFGSQAPEGVNTDVGGRREAVSSWPCPAHLACYRTLRANQLWHGAYSVRRWLYYSRFEESLNLGTLLCLKAQRTY